MARWAASVLLLLGCSIDDLDFTGTMFQCPDGVTCPPGFTCISGVCQPPADAVVDAPPACGAIELLHDSFDGATIDSALWQPSMSGSGMVVQSGGDARIQLGAGTGTGAYVSIQPANLVSSAVYIDVISVAMGTNVETFFRAGADDNNFLEIVQKNGVIYANQRIGGTLTTLGSTGYNNVNQRWWRIAEQQATVTFDTSADGSTWSSAPLGTTSTPPFAGDVLLQFGARGTSLGSSTEADFDNLNGGGAPAGPCTRG